MASPNRLPSYQGQSVEAIKASLPKDIQEALAYEETVWAKGSLSHDEFYIVSEDTANAAPGSILKVERQIDTSDYTIPPGLALSRFIYQSQSHNGSLVPVSAIVLWPYAPRKNPDGYQVVAWAHGTSCFSRDTAPSHHKNLWQHYLGPFQLALQGYVVIAMDYAGLGVEKDTAGKLILHEYLAGPSQANDVLNPVLAARAAFPEQFVVAVEPMEGYLGAVAMAPVTDMLKDTTVMTPLLTAVVCKTIHLLNSEFDRSEVLTLEAESSMELLDKLGCIPRSAMPLFFAAGPMLKPDFKSNIYVQRYFDTVKNCGKPIDGPLLVMHGSADPIVAIDNDSAAVEETASRFPDASIEYVTIPEVSHNAAMTAGQRVWMDWINDRFSGAPAAKGYKSWSLETARPLAGYQKELNWYISQATKFYHTP